VADDSSTCVLQRLRHVKANRLFLCTDFLFWAASEAHGDYCAKYGFYLTIFLHCAIFGA